MPLRRLLATISLCSAGLVLAAEAPPEPEALQDARALFNARRNDDAKAAFTKLAAEQPTLAEAHHFLGLLALRRGDFDAAIASLQRAVELKPDSVNYQLRLGDAFGTAAAKASLFSKLGFAKKCRAQYEKAVALDPRSIDARWSLMEYFKQAPGVAGGSFEKAHEQADAIILFNPGAGRFAKATIYAAEKKVPEAFALYDGLLTAESTDYSAHSQFGRLAVLTRQKAAEGIAAFRKCLTLTPPSYEPGHAVVQWYIGQLQELLGDKSAARLAYQAALAVDANFKPAAEALTKLK